MRCHHCSSGRIKRAENYGADRMQCGSCGIVTKQAHHSLTEKQQALINYLSNWNSERIENSREAPQQLSQLGVAAAINVHRSNINRIVAPLIRDGLVKQKLAHVTDDDGRVFGRVKKTVYYLTRDGYQHVTESRRAETFESEIKFNGGFTRPLEDMKMIWLHYTTDLNGDTMPHLTFDTYKGNRRERFINYWGGRPDGLSNPDGITIEDINELIQAHNDWVDETGGFIGLHQPIRDELGIDTLSLEKLSYPWNGDYVRQGYGRSESWRTARENFYEAETFESETFRANWFSNLLGRKSSAVDWESLEDVDINSVSRNAGGLRVWEAVYFACIDEGLTPVQAEQVANSKFIRKMDPGLIVPALTKSLRPFVKEWLKHTDARNTVPETKSSESFEADERMYLGVQVSKRGDKYYYLQINDRNIGDRFAILEFNKDWKMGGHEKPHWELGMDDGRFVTVKSFNEGIKRFKRMSTEYLSPSRREPPVGTYAHTAAWLANAGLMTGDEADRWKDEMKERDAESFEAHDGSHLEDIHYESDTYPLNPTRPSGPWPMPSPRPRRPNRRPNRRPSPRPQRRPF